MGSNDAHVYNHRRTLAADASVLSEGSTAKISELAKATSASEMRSPSMYVLEARCASSVAIIPGNFPAANIVASSLASPESHVTTGPNVMRSYSSHWSTSASEKVSLPQSSRSPLRELRKRRIELRRASGPDSARRTGRVENGVEEEAGLGCAA